MRAFLLQFVWQNKTSLWQEHQQ